MSALPLLDYSNPLHTFNNASGTYTCTSECYLVGSISPMDASGSASFAINGCSLLDMFGNATEFVGPLKLKTGDIVTVSVGGNYPRVQLAVLKEVS